MQHFGIIFFLILSNFETNSSFGAPIIFFIKKLPVCQKIATFIPQRLAGLVFLALYAFSKIYMPATPPAFAYTHIGALHWGDCTHK